MDFTPSSGEPSRRSCDCIRLFRVCDGICVRKNGNTSLRICGQLNPVYLPRPLWCEYLCRPRRAAIAEYLWQLRSDDCKRYARAFVVLTVGTQREDLELVEGMSNGGNCNRMLSNTLTRPSADCKLKVLKRNGTPEVGIFLMQLPHTIEEIDSWMATAFAEY